ncbi:MAG: MotA/TolQ/ExbB proton channel [Fibrobacteres bacterium]|nr:MotA/TolQ/ExbB proton channel [Fibrobacterota bacterium]
MNDLIQNLAPALLILEKGLLALLLALGAASLAIFLWRWRSYNKAQGQPQKWIRILTQEMSSPRIPAIALSPADDATLAGRVVRTGLANQGLNPDALDKVFEVQESAEKRELEKGLSFLGTVGANAPFLGLTGTVIGILVAFERFAASGGKGSTEVMVSISQALVATAIGLVVAIPAVVFFNLLKQKSKSVLEGAREVRGLIVARSLQAGYANASGRED